MFSIRHHNFESLYVTNLQSNKTFYVCPYILDSLLESAGNFLPPTDRRDIYYLNLVLEICDHSELNNSVLALVWVFCPQCLGYC